MIQISSQNLALGRPLGIQIKHRNRYKFCSYTTNTENQSADIKLSLPANKKITIHWGNGEFTVITGEVTTTVYSHTYTDIKTYNLTVSGDYNDISYLQFNGDGSYGGDIKYFPLNLNMIYASVKNTFSGNDFLRFIKMESIYIYGENIIFTPINKFPPKLRRCFIAGFNKIYGDLADFPDTNFYGYQFLDITGHNAISEYSGKTWTTNFDIFKVVPYSGGLSSAEMDLLLNDFDEDLDWSGGGQIVLSGTNAPRTSASDDAVDNIVAEGGTVITNN